MSDMSGDNEPCIFLWQHEHNKKWITYSEEQLNALNIAYKRGQKTVTLPSRNPKMQLLVTFEKMVQKNKVSSYEQRIRCGIYNNAFYVWQWKDDNGYWESYIPSIALSLEVCYHKKEKKFKFFHKSDYEVSLDKMTQLCEDNGRIMDISREKVDVDISNQTLQNISVHCASCIIKLSEQVKTGAKKQKIDHCPLMEVQLPASLSAGIVAPPVDPECSEASQCHVYSEGNVVYDAMLNQTCLQRNNNKFFILQLLKSNKKCAYSVWFRWGRVGNRGQSSLTKFNSNLDGAKQGFERKFYDKTKNKWEAKESFQKVPLKYDLVRIAPTNEANLKVVENRAISKLDASVKSLLVLICDKKCMEDIVKEMEYDSDRTPLGRLTVDQIKLGYASLNKIADILKYDGRGRMLVEACDEFYTRIPHNFGRRTPLVISSMDVVKQKIKMLETLANIHEAMNVMSGEVLQGEHPLDKYYRSLDCILKPLDRGSETFTILETYLKNTHAPTHSEYILDIMDIFECYKQDEERAFKDYGNKMLLWHGSRLSNWLGILKKSLQIAPPEAPSTGYMFGKGIYFADMSSKSANYCFASKMKDEGFLLLCEVSLGNMLEKHQADSFAASLPDGYHSVKGIGKIRPKLECETEICGAKIPYGVPENNPAVGGDGGLFRLNYNEYIVYDINQVKMRYLLKVKFNFI